MLKKFFRKLGLSSATKLRKASKSSSANSHRHLRHEALENRRMLATLTVNVAHDDVDSGGIPFDSNGELTLRDAIAYVNKTATPVGDEFDQIDLTEPLGTNDTILFAASLDGATITLDQGATSPTAGKELKVVNPVIIDATALAGGLTIAGTGGVDGVVSTGDGARVFNIGLFGSIPGVVGSDFSHLLNDSWDVTLAGLTITGGDAKVAEFALAV